MGSEMNYEINVELGRIGRTNAPEPGWENISKLDNSMWSEAEKLLGKIVYQYGGSSVVVSSDLSVITSWYEHDLTRGKVLRNPQGFSEEIRDSIWLDSEVILKCVVKFEGVVKFGDAQQRRAEVLVEKYLYDVFFVMNIALPGCCEFLNARVMANDGFALKYGGAEALHLSSYSFELAHDNYLDGDVFAPRPLCLKDVFDWYQALNLGVSQKADTSTARAIFALLHMCKSEASIATVIWIFHALESIFSTRIGEGVPGITARMMFLLDLDSRYQKRLNKGLRELYDCRSAFVHGNYDVHHPMGNEQLDERLDDDRGDMYRVCSFGFNLIVLSLQNLISKGWVGLTVAESVVGVSITKSSE